MATDRNRRLRDHPQVRDDIEIYRVRVFDCVRCGRTFYVRGARELADGRLVCPGCWRSEDEHGTARCRACGRMVPADELVPEHDYTDCSSCRAAGKDRSRLCEWCGEPFTAGRADARYCSGACRVAAHRSRRAAVPRSGGPLGRGPLG